MSEQQQTKPVPANRPTKVLAELYHENVRMRVDSETGKLTASLNGPGKLTPEQRARIKEHVKHFKPLLVWREDMADKLGSKMLRISWQGKQRVSERELEACREAIATAEELFNEAHAIKDMGLLRYACWLYVRQVKLTRREFKMQAQEA